MSLCPHPPLGILHVSLPLSLHIRCLSTITPLGILRVSLTPSGILRVSLPSRLLEYCVSLYPQPPLEPTMALILVLAVIQKVFFTANMIVPHIHQTLKSG